MQMAINLDELADTYYGGLVSGDPQGPVSPENVGWVVPYEDWSDDLKAEYAYDPEGAMALLDAAGYTADPTTGIRFETNIVTGSNNDLDILQICKDYLLDIGVDMEIRVMEPGVAFSFTMTKQHDQMSMGIGSGMTPPLAVALFCVTSEAIWNPCCHGDAYIDGLYEDFLAAPDMASAKEIMKEGDQYALQQHWNVNLPPRILFDAAQPYVKGWSGEFISEWYRSWYWTRLWIDQELK
jgi:ABC-type transport system substrate-binding protein